MKQYMMTRHVINDRIDRLTLIATYIGWGEVIHEQINYERKSILSLTNTGIVLVKDMQSKTIITAYPASISRITTIYHAMGVERVPQYLFEKARKNEKIMRKYNCF